MNPNSKPVPGIPFAFAMNSQMTRECGPEQPLPTADATVMWVEVARRQVMEAEASQCNPTDRFLDDAGRSGLQCAARDWNVIAAKQQLDRAMRAQALSCRLMAPPPMTINLNPNSTCNQPLWDRLRWA